MLNKHKVYGNIYIYIYIYILYGITLFLYLTSSFVFVVGNTTKTKGPVYKGYTHCDL
jgi:hypothetical protein